jgi:hypothetical protein
MSIGTFLDNLLNLDWKYEFDFQYIPISLIRINREVCGECIHPYSNSDDYCGYPGDIGENLYKIKKFFNKGDIDVKLEKFDDILYIGNDCENTYLNLNRTRLLKKIDVNEKIKLLQSCKERIDSCKNVYDSYQENINISCEIYDDLDYSIQEKIYPLKNKIKIFWEIFYDIDDSIEVKDIDKINYKDNSICNYIYGKLYDESKDYKKAEIYYKKSDLAIAQYNYNYLILDRKIEGDREEALKNMVKNIWTFLELSEFCYKIRFHEIFNKFDSMLNGPFDFFNERDVLSHEKIQKKNKSCNYKKLLKIYDDNNS